MFSLYTLRKSPSSPPARLCQTYLLFLLIGFALPATSDTAAPPPSASNIVEPHQVVEQLHQHLIDIMTAADELGYQGRFAKLEPFISANFDTALIAKVVLSRYWKTLTDEQKNNFIELFNRLSISTYASRFDSYNGERFVEISREELKKGRLIIKTELQSPQEDPVFLNYLMHERDGKWYIISVIANGVNDLSLKRAEYAAVIKDKGFEGLVEDIESKIRDMEEGTSP